MQKSKDAQGSIAPWGDAIHSDLGCWFLTLFLIVKSSKFTEEKIVSTSLLKSYRYFRLISYSNFALLRGVSGNEDLHFKTSQVP